MSIKNALKLYAKKVAGGYWVIKSNFEVQEVEKEHSVIIATLARIGGGKEYKVWIGKTEQSHSAPSSFDGEKELREFVTYKDVRSLTNIKNPKIVEDIDVLWIEEDRVICAFEVEATTSMISGLVRASNIEKGIPKFLVIPEERETQLLNKMKSPMFKERFESDGWRILYFGALLEEYRRRKGKTDIFMLEDRKVLRKALYKKEEESQLDLFNG